MARNPQLARTDPATARAFILCNEAFSDRRRQRLALELLLADFHAEEALVVFCRSLSPADAEAGRKSAETKASEAERTAQELIALTKAQPATPVAVPPKAKRGFPTFMNHPWKS